MPGESTATNQTDRFAVYDVGSERWRYRVSDGELVTYIAYQTGGPDGDPHLVIKPDGSAAIAGMYCHPDAP